MKVNVLLIGAAMAAMAGGAGAAEPEPNAVFGVLSDIHLVPGDRRSDGGHVERLFVYGDHETLEFEVRPANAFGAQGEPIRSEPRSFNPTPCATTLW